MLCTEPDSFAQTAIPTVWPVGVCTALIQRVCGAEIAGRIRFAINAILVSREGREGVGGSILSCPAAGKQ